MNNIITKHIPTTDRIKATHKKWGSKYTHIDPGLVNDMEKMHEIAAYNLMVKNKKSVKWKLSLLETSSILASCVWVLEKR